MVLKRALASLRGRRPDAAAPPPEVVRARDLTSERAWDAAAEAWAIVAGTDDARLGPEPWLELARASRLSRDLPAAYDAVERGRSRYPDELGLAVELARTALRGYAASAEDERHTWKARLLDARALLAGASDRGEVTKPSLQAAAEIELVLRRWEDAVALWGELERRYPDRADEAIVKQAAALRASGELAAASATLARASAAAREGDEARALARAIAAAEDVAAANAAFTAARAAWHAGDADVLRDELPAAIRRRGHPEERVTRLLPLLDDLASFVAAAAAGRRVPGPERQADAHGIGDVREGVLVSGFLYSGSGAVFDLLRQFEEFHLPFGDRETGFLKKPDHLATVLDGADAARMPDPATVAAAVLASTVGFGQTGRPLLGWAARDDAAVDRLVLQLRWLVAELRHTWAEVGDDRSVAEPRTAGAIRRFVDAFLADHTPRGRRALLNNPIVGHQLQHLRLVSRSVAVAVLRDPRDQYVSQRLESPYAMGAEDFIPLMAERYRAYADLLADAALRDRLVTVGFERFVTDTDERTALLDRLGVDPEARNGAPTFDAERSRRNIGIHTAHADQDEITRVAEALLEPYEDLVGRAAGPSAHRRRGGG